MKCLAWCVILALITTVSVQAAVPDLSDSQRTALSDVSEGSAVLEEAGLYALLSNVAQWEDDPAAGARIPDYTAMREQPETYRGERFFLRGRLHARVDFQSRPQRISRPGWEDVQLWQVQVRTGERGADLGTLVYLIEPAMDEGELRWLDGETVRYGVPSQRDRPVEIVARFYKHVRLPDRSGEPMTYPVFVAHSVHFVDSAAEASGSGGASTAGSVAVIVALLILFGGAYALFRFGLLKRREPVRPSERWRAMREAAAGESDGTDDDADGALDLRDDLPEDPSEAMALLADEHRNAETVVIDSPSPNDAKEDDPHRPSSTHAHSESRTRS